MSSRGGPTNLPFLRARSGAPQAEGPGAAVRWGQEELAEVGRLPVQGPADFQALWGLP